MNWVCLIRETYKMCRTGGPPGQVWEALAYDIAGDYFQALRHITAPAAQMVLQQSSLIITPEWEYSS